MSKERELLQRCLDEFEYKGVACNELCIDINKLLAKPEQGYKYKLRNGYDRLYGGKLTNNLVQGTARCIMSEAMVRVSRRYDIVLTIHDALYILAPEAEAEEALKFLMEEMTNPPIWMPDIPLAAEGGYGRSLKDAG